MGSLAGHEKYRIICSHAGLFEVVFLHQKLQDQLTTLPYSTARSIHSETLHIATPITPSFTAIVPRKQGGKDSVCDLVRD